MIAKKLLLIDTGPLRELITFRAVFGLGFQRLKNQLMYISGQHSFKKFSQYIGSFQNRSTTPAVIVELANWVRQTDASGKQQLWALIYDEFRQMRMEERSVKLLEMRESLVARCGPTDIGLLTLAQQQIGSNPVVLTNDRELITECHLVNIQSVQIQQIIERPVF